MFYLHLEKTKLSWSYKLLLPVLVRRIMGKEERVESEDQRRLKSNTGNECLIQ